MDTRSSWETYYPGVFDTRKIEKLIGPFLHCVKRRKENGEYRYRQCTAAELAEAEWKSVKAR